MSDMKGYCGRCKKRNICKKLCKEVEDYVNKGNVEQQEFIGIYPVGDEVLEETGWKIHPDDDIYNDDFYKNKKLVITLYKSGMLPIEIGYHIPFDISWIYRIIKEYNKKLTEIKN